MDSTPRLDAFGRLFGENPSEATDGDVQALFGNLAPSGEELMDLSTEIGDRINAFFDDPTEFIDLQVDEEVRKRLRLLGSGNRDLFPPPPTPIQGHSLPLDPFAEPVVVPPLADDPPPDPPPREPPPREPPQAPELPPVLRIFVAAVNGAYPSLAIAVQHDAWPGLRQEIEDAHRAVVNQVDGAWGRLIRLSLGIHARVLAETSNVALADAAKAYADAAAGGFSHPSYKPDNTYKRAWRIAAGHPHVP